MPSRDLIKRIPKNLLSDKATIDHLSSEYMGEQTLGRELTHTDSRQVLPLTA
jgi:hypothetical protein